MWSQVTITNFRALRSVDVRLRPLTVLVGANDSGKSSFLEALSCMAGQAPISLTQRWQHNPAEMLDLQGLFGDKRIRCWAEGRADAQYDLGSYRGPALQGHPPFVDSIRALRHQLFHPSPDTIALHERGTRSSHDRAPELETAGAGLARFLDYLLRRDRRRFFAVLEAAKALIPGLEDIEIVTPSEELRAIHLRIVGDVVIPPAEVSEGVRLLLFFLALSYHPDPPSVVLIEEPETGVHPRRLGTIMEAIRAMVDGTRNGGHETQVILSTHSPYLLDCIDLETDQVLVFERQPSGECVVREADHERLKVFLDEFLLGEVWYNEGERALAGIVE